VTAAAAARLDVTLQRRSGVLAATTVVTLLWAAGVMAVPPSLRGQVALAAIAIDAGIVGFVFAGGMVLLERRDGTLRALGVSPLPAATYVSVRIVTLTASAVVASVVLSVVAGLPPARILLVVPAVVGLSMPVLLAALLVVARVGDVTRFLLWAQLVVSPAVVPLLAHLGWLPSLTGAVVPTDAGVQFLAAATGTAPVSPARLALGSVYALCATVVLWRSAVRAVDTRLYRGAET
jgi:hypothetical protein